MSDLPIVAAAIDGDDAAPAVLALAKTLATPQRGGRWYAVHAVRPPELALQTLLFPYACLGDDLDAIRAELLGAAADDLRNRFRAALPEGDDTLRTAWGHPVDALRSLTDGLGPDWLVAGHGRNDLRATGQLGPVAAGLARLSNRPLVLADPRREHGVVRTIVAALDLTPHAVGVLATAVELAVRLDARVVPVAVEPTVDDRLHGDGSRDNRGRSKKELRARFTRVLEALELPFATDTERDQRLDQLDLRIGDPGPELAAAAQEHDADLVVAGRCHPVHGPASRLGRVAEYVARHAPCHVALVAGGHGTAE